MPDSTQLDSLRPGTQLNGIYEIDTFLKSGGMGDVYKGHEISTQHLVAIKVIRREFAENELVRSMFHNEASHLAQVHHEAIVGYRIFAVDPTVRRTYLAMDFVDGETLSQVIRRGPMRTETAARLAARLARGLHAAHARGITHRDISPDNVIMQGDDVEHATIIDFGIARATRAGEETIVDTGFVGKYNYVAPEQLGEYGGEITPRSDIYSLGLVLAAALRGEPLDMSGRLAEVISKRRRVPPLDDLDPLARPIVATMLQPDPADRPRNMLEVARAFEDLPSKASTPPPSPAPTPGDGGKQVRAAIIVGLVATTGIGAGAYALWPKPRATEAKIATAPDPAVVAPPARLETPPPTAEKILRYLAAYRGGTCVLIVPYKVTSTFAEIDGFGLSRTPFDELDEAFAAEFGFESHIQAKIVWRAQCPVLAFLEQLRSDPKLAPRIDLVRKTVQAGTLLNGTVSTTPERKLALLLVSADGSVEDVTRFLRPGTGTSSFEIPIGRPAQPGEPRVLLAFASAERLEPLTGPGTQRSDKVFPKLLAERRLDTTQLGTALGFFHVN
jgi:tRNA A-37 threonylcarbamoyl transferase component Bud32